MAALRQTLLAMAVAGPAAAASVITYVDSVPPGGCPTPRCDALGYPVPLPVDSQAAVDGFRSYAALSARLQDLAATRDDIAEVGIGRTVKDRPISAYVVGDADARTAGDLPEPAFLVDATIHAREWAAPEVAAGLVERFAARAADAGLYRYLLDALTLVVVPVLNVDGFLQTQRFPDRALTTSAPDDPADWPRDGRMRRKTLRDADEDLLTQADDLLGVDCNRNNAPFFDSGNQNSDDPRSLLFHGAAAGSEPETQALYAAAALGPEPRLRGYVDIHSFSRLLYGVETGQARHDLLTQALGATLRAVTGNRYDYVASRAPGIGSTDERFGYADRIPSYTLEIEPRDGPRSEYGIGFGVTHDGFILPASQIARVREELADALVAAAYRMAGPPAIAAVELRERAGGTVVYAAQWTRVDDLQRRLDVSVRSALQPDTDYTLWLAFDKPMRVRDAGGAVVQYRGQGVPLAPRIAVEGIDARGDAFGFTVGTSASGWRNAGDGAPAGRLRYADDAYAVDFRTPASAPLAGAPRVLLAIDAEDFTGQRLDANPATVVDWSAGAWARFEDGSGNAANDRGGTDRTLRLVDEPVPAGGGDGGGGALPATTLLLLLLTAGLRRRF